MPPQDSPKLSTPWQFPVTGGLVLALPGLDGLYLLNPSAAFIWQQMSLGSSPNQISANLAETFRIPTEVATRDVQATLHQWEDLFRHENAVHPSPPAPTHTASEQISIACHWNGKHFHVTLDSPELQAEITPRLSALRVPQAEPDFTLTLTTAEDAINLHCGAEFIAAEPNVSAARAILLQEIARRCATTPRQWLSLLHAGACGNHRSCVIFPAASRSGKTTLAAVLMQGGLTFYADDSVALEKETLEIPVMPFGLPIREGSWPLLAERVPGFDHLPVSQRFGQQIRFIYPAVHQASVRAAAIVFPSYAPGSKLSIHPLNTLEALIHLKESGFWVENQQESINGFLAWLESLRCFQMAYAQVDEAAGFITTLLQ